MAGYDPVIFDLDGTVVDTVELIRQSFRYATRTVLGRVLPDREIMAYVGQPLMRQMEQLAPDRARELYDVYRAHNHRVHDELIRTYEGIEEALAGLKEAGKRLGLVTSKSADTTDMAFRAVGLREYFDAVVTASDSDHHKPDPEPLLLCLRRLSAASAGAIYVGDSPFDIEAGHAAGIDTAAVTWGIFARADLEAAEPTYVLTAPPQLVELCIDGRAPARVEDGTSVGNDQSSTREGEDVSEAER